MSEALKANVTQEDVKQIFIATANHARSIVSRIYGHQDKIFATPSLEVSSTLPSGVVGQAVRDSNGNHKVVVSEHLLKDKYELTDTIRHEVAHILTEFLFGKDNVLEHGKEWRAMAVWLGCVPTVSSETDVSKLKLRYYVYRPGLRSNRPHVSPYVLSGLEDFLVKALVYSGAGI